MISINYLNCKFYSLKLWIKYKLINHIVNNIRLTQNLTCILRTCWTCNLMVRFSKYVVTFILLSKVVTLSYN